MGILWAHTGAIGFIQLSYSNTNCTMGSTCCMQLQGILKQRTKQQHHIHVTCYRAEHYVAVHK